MSAVAHAGCEVTGSDEAIQESPQRLNAIDRVFRATRRRSVQFVPRCPDGAARPGEHVRHRLGQRAASLGLRAPPDGPLKAGIDFTNGMSRRESWTCAPDSWAARGRPR